MFDGNTWNHLTVFKEMILPNKIIHVSLEYFKPFN